MPPYPKPKPKVKARKAIQRVATTRKSPYQHPRWRKKVREVRQRSKGLCEARVRCGGNPVQGDPHHLKYHEGKRGIERIDVPLDWLLDCCRPCHLSFHPEKP